MDNFFHNEQADTRRSGFALFYAVVVVAVVSSLGSVLANLIVREANLSATARQSSRAFYNADAGLECAQFWDIKEDWFPRGGAVDNGNIACAGDASIDVTATTNSNGNEEYSFLMDTSNICADVTVTKTEDGSREITRLESIGSDTCSGSTQARRALRSRY